MKQTNHLAVHEGRAASADIRRRAAATPGRARARRLASMASILLVSCSSVGTTGVASPAGGAIAYALSGQGVPAVVLQSGLGDGKAVWASVIGEAGKRHQVFVYDRPGYGDSPANGAARDPCSIASEARQVLAAAGVKPPYILIGHSLGGLYQYVFAKMYADEVAGVVLLDPTHPQHLQSMQQDAPAAAAMLKALRITLLGATERREFDAQAACLERIDMSQPLSVPTRLLVSTTFSTLEKGGFESMVRRLRKDWLRLTGAQQLQEVAGSGHYIQRERPAAVLEAIEAVAQRRALPLGVR